MSDEQLQEYISDIRSAVGGLFNQSGQGDQYSGLKGLRPEPKPQTGSDSEDSIVYGINSTDNSESLYSLLGALVKNELLSDEQRKQLVQLMLQQTAKDEIVLEAIGDPQRDNRTFSSDTVTKLNALINTFNLQDNAKSQLEKVLNRWAKLNTVKFGSPTAATAAPRAAASPEKPKKDPNFDGETGVPITDKGRDMLLDMLSNATTIEQFNEIYNRLLQSKYGDGKDRDAIKKAIENNEPTRISTFGNTEKEKRIAVRKKFIQLALKPNPPKEETSGEEEPQA